MKDNTNRLLSIHILEILNKYSDAKNTMSQVEIINKLEEAELKEEKDEEELIENILNK